MAPFFFNDTTNVIDREVLHYTGAYVDKETGALVVTTPPDPPLVITGWPNGVYHKYDYALWYRNLEANVKTRCKNYLEQN